MAEPTAEIAIIGGSGFYRFLDDAQEVKVETPWGAPSGPISVRSVGGRSVAFLARHGPELREVLIAAAVPAVLKVAGCGCRHGGAPSLRSSGGSAEVVDPT